MKDLGTLLRETDPLIREDGLLPADVARMRRAIVAAADHESATAVWWPRPLVVAATVAVTLVGGVVVGRWLPSRDATIAAPSQSAASHDRRQLQFATPGGTRIIWVFDSEFNLNP
jgi:hypothetical protein